MSNLMQGSNETSPLEIHKMLVLSTTHIRPETADNFRLLTDDVPRIFFPKAAHDGEEYGWFIPISPEMHWSHTVSEDLRAIRKIAEREGCSWIMLDQAGEEIDELPTYEW